MDEVGEREPLTKKNMQISLCDLGMVTRKELVSVFFRVNFLVKKLFYVEILEEYLFENEGKKLKFKENTMS